MNSELKRKRILDIDPQAILWDGLDEAIIGITEEGVPVYDIHQMEILLMKQHEWEWEDAAEWVEFNILRAYLGDRTPIHMWAMPVNEFDEVNRIAQNFGLTDNNE
jgi:hypothetical protein